MGKEVGFGIDQLSCASPFVDQPSRPRTHPVWEERGGPLSPLLAQRARKLIEFESKRAVLVGRAQLENKRPPF